MNNVINRAISAMKKSYINPKAEIITVAMTNTLCASGRPKTVTFGSGKASGGGL